MLEHEADVAVAGRRCVTSSSLVQHRAVVGRSRPAMMRSSVVLPEPDGPRSASSEPLGTLEADVLERLERPNRLLTFFDRDAHVSSSL